jgi:general secretion pathway protein D
MRIPLLIIVIGLAGALASGCAAGRAFSKGESLEREGKFEEAMYSYAEAFRLEPESGEYRVRFLGARDRAAVERWRRGSDLYEHGEYAAALIEFQTACGLDPSQGKYRQMSETSARKRDAKAAFQEGAEFEKVHKQKDALRFYSRAAELCPEEKEYGKARDRMQGLLRNSSSGFELNLASVKPFTFKLRNAGTRDAFRILTQLSGIQFVFDEAVKDQQVSLSLDKTNFPQVLQLLTTMNKLGSTVLNGNTVLIYPKTPDKIKQYEEMRIRTFHLTYLDAKKAVNLVRTVVPTRKIHVNEESNSLVVRDTAEVLDVIEKLLDANDAPDAEVVLDIEVVELTDKNTRNVGLVLSRYAVDLGAFNLGSGQLLSDTLNTTDSSSSTAAMDSLAQVFSWKGYGGFVTVANATYNFSKTVAKGEVLSNPKIRIKNKEKAKFNIGTRYPITTTSTNGTSGGYSVNVQYVDVGVKVDAQPTIQLNNEIGIKLSLEVSSILSKDKLGDGTTTVVTIGTRNLETVLSLKDGETSVIGGLISRTDIDSKSKIFLLGDLPLIGPLLSGTDTSKDRTELLLAITPRLVRGVTVNPQSMVSFVSGREDDPSLGMFPDLPDPDSAVGAEPARTDAPPRGRRSRAQQPAPPPGASVPAAVPADASQSAVNPSAAPGSGSGVSGAPLPTPARSDTVPATPSPRNGAQPVPSTTVSPPLATGDAPRK